MRLTLKRIAILFLISIPFHSAFSQQTIKGLVKNASTGAPVGSASVMVKGGSMGTTTDDQGRFSLSIQSLPVSLVFSGVGFMTEEKRISTLDEVRIDLKPSSGLGQEVVISASRVPEKILESPVSIERVNATSIRNSAGANYYDIIKSLKGVDVTTSSLTFSTPTTRGFNSSGNTRFNQLVDGMDNQAPGLNFPVASIIGLSELDVDNMELLSGASSALYGSGGMNGTLLINSKNPFKYQGLSMLAKEGVMHLGDGQQETSSYHNLAVRWAKKVNEKFAFKANVEYIRAQDWLGSDYRNYARLATGGNLKAGTRDTDPNYDGINVYGDETTTDIRQIIKAVPWLQNFPIPNTPIFVSRTGYQENQIVNPTTINFKLSGSLHYKLSEKTEAILAGYWGTGNTTYTGSERYSLEDFKMGQYKLELNNKDWTLRAFTTQENSGNSYNTTVATRLFNESWSPSVRYDAFGDVIGGWYIDYTDKYANSKLDGQSDADAHRLAREYADRNRPAHTDASFKASFDSIRARTLAEGGAKLVDRSALYSTEGTYNLSKFTSNFADIIVGAVYKNYQLRSDGNLFTDAPGSPISVYEYGGYAQATRKIGDKIKVQVSGRYDKNENFKGRFTPRATATYKLAELNHVRLSYQTAYRFPSNQQQFIDLGIGSGVRLLGGNEIFKSKYDFNNQLYDLNAFSQGKVVKFDWTQLKPEAITSYEIGYRGLLNEGNLLVDMYFYWGQYQDFLGRSLTVQFKDGIPTNHTLSDTTNRYYSLPVNTTDKVKTYGFGVSLDYKLPSDFMIGLNVASDVLQDVPENFVAYFNAPKYKANFNFGNSGFGSGKRYGFNLTYRWQQALLYEGDFATGNLPDVNVVDAQVSYKLPKTRSILKVGANNLFNSYYYNAIGNSRIGGLYYLSLGYNIY